MYLLVDNYDSFTDNLASYLVELGCSVDLRRNDRVGISDAETLLSRGELEGVIISPGPKTPADCGSCREIVAYCAGKVPVLGVCLGHQVIGSVFGARVRKGSRPMHGKVTPIFHGNQGLFAGLPQGFCVTRYHSLVVEDEGLPAMLRVDARAEDGAIMALSHRMYPVYGLQFHPEAVLTEYGHEILGAFIRSCNLFWEQKSTERSVA